MPKFNREWCAESRAFPWAPLLFAGTFMAFALIANEWTAVRYLSPDGVLSTKVRAALGGIDVFF